MSIPAENSLCSFKHHTAACFLVLSPPPRPPHASFTITTTLYLHQPKLNAEGSEHKGPRAKPLGDTKPPRKERRATALPTPPPPRRAQSRRLGNPHPPPRRRPEGARAPAGGRSPNKGSSGASGPANPALQGGGVFVCFRFCFVFVFCSSHPLGHSRRPPAQQAPGPAAPRQAARGTRREAAGGRHRAGPAARALLMCHSPGGPRLRGPDWDPRRPGATRGDPGRGGPVNNSAGPRGAPVQAAAAAANLPAPKPRPPEAPPTARRQAPPSGGPAPAADPAPREASERGLGPAGIPEAAAAAAAAAAPARGPRHRSRGGDCGPGGDCGAGAGSARRSPLRAPPAACTGKPPRTPPPPPVLPERGQRGQGGLTASGRACRQDPRAQVPRPPGGPPQTPPSCAVPGGRLGAPVREAVFELAGRICRAHPGFCGKHLAALLSLSDKENKGIRANSHLAPLECKALPLRGDAHVAKPKLIDLERETERAESVPAELIGVQVIRAKGFSC
ncbi:basic proline-rich protein-like [Canis lupus dingo]|uniref:basic proline-rich protein-like n=1 Tax=Canis lupus dingo TaxID=286419 RepID=UPI0020C4FCB9|nr:basic proline-rich protein-like [Canis lupus dingo]